MKSGSSRIVLFLLLLIWCIGFAAPLFLNEGNAAVAGLLLTNFYSPVCHQVPGKCITAGSLHFLVCARCTGIYTGALIMSIISLFTRQIKSRFAVAALILIAADIFLVNAGIYGYSKTIAFSTGMLVGLTLFPYILSALEKSFSVNEI